MRKVWFSSDFHFNHTNICGPAISSWSAGFRNFNSLIEMNNTIINNLNSRVMADDVLYFLGDFAFGDKSRIPELRSRINCHEIHLIYGNHDEVIRKTHNYRILFASCNDIIVQRFGKQEIRMSHEPTDVWTNNHRGTFSVFGHVHNNFQHCNGQRMDVGVDTNNFMPYSLDEVVDICKAKTPFLPDHHR